MNREIKFRAWNGETMNYSIIAGKFGAFWVNAGKNNDGLDENDKASLTQFNTKCSENTKVMQFTGLKDKNGKEIYEGDICDCWTNLSQDSGNFINEVIYKDGAFGYSNGDDFHSFANHSDISKPIISDWEVIGNIYENPELIA